MNLLMLPISVAVVCIGVTMMVYARFISRHGQWKPITAPTRFSRLTSDVQGLLGAVNRRALLLAVAGTIIYWLLTVGCLLWSLFLYSSSWFLSSCCPRIRVCRSLMKWWRGWVS